MFFVLCLFFFFSETVIALISEEQWPFFVLLSAESLFYLKNTGVNFLLSYCIIFFVLLGVFCFASFVWNWFTSISKEKGLFSVILSDELFFVTSRIQA